MGLGLPPLEFTECMTDSPYFRENLHQHERELEQTNLQIKHIIKEVKDLLTAAKQLSNAQKSFANCLDVFTFECIGGTQTDDEQVICKSLTEFSKLIKSVEDERERMLNSVYSYVLKPLEDFRKKYIGGVKNEKKKFEKQTAKFCQCQERYLNLTTKKQNSLQEADASVDMAERHFYTASMDYVYLIQEVHERKKFEFVETLLTFLFGWLTFYHQGYEVAKDFHPYMADLQQKIQKTRTNFDDYSNKLRRRMAEVQKQYLDEPVRNSKGCKEGYLFLLEKKAFGATWTKHFCKYDRESKEFTMLPYNQLTTKALSQPETMVLTSCVRRMSDSIEKRFCFDLQLNSKPGVVLTFQALSEQDRKSWMDIMDGKEPTYTTTNYGNSGCSSNKSASSNNNSTTNNNNNNVDERPLDDVGIYFVRRCIEVLDGRGNEEQGIYRVVGVASKVNKLLAMGLDRRKPPEERLVSLDDGHEWDTKTITSALKSYLRNLPEPLMTYRYHIGFMAAVKNETRQMRINDVHILIYRLPKTSFDVLKMLIKHLSSVAAKCDKNLMTVSNLGVCFGPTLLRPEEETVASIMDLKFYNIVVEILIDNYDVIFNSEPPLPIPQQSSPSRQLSPTAAIMIRSSTSPIHQKLSAAPNNNNAVMLRNSSTGQLSLIETNVPPPPPPLPPSHTYRNGSGDIYSKSYTAGTTGSGGNTHLNNNNNINNHHRHSDQPSYYNYCIRRMQEQQVAAAAVPPPYTGPPPLYPDANGSGGGGRGIYSISGRGGELSPTHYHHLVKMQQNYPKIVGIGAAPLPPPPPPQPPHHRFTVSTVSQSESNIPKLTSSTTYYYRTTSTLMRDRIINPNSASSSNESVSSTSRDGGGTNHHHQIINANNYNTIPIPQKTERSNNILIPYPKGYRSPGNVTQSRVELNYLGSTTTSGRSSPLPRVRRVRTLYACLGEHDGELSFEPNQIITNVKNSQEPGWLEGTLNGKTGLIPENYVEILP